MKKPSTISAAEDYAIKLEARSLDAIHKVLADYPAGLDARGIANLTGMGIGYVEALLKKQTSVIKRKGRVWIADMKDLPRHFRPQPAAGPARNSHNGKGQRQAVTPKKEVTRSLAGETKQQNEADRCPSARVKKTPDRAAAGSPNPVVKRGPGRHKGSRNRRVRPD